MECIFIYVECELRECDKILSVKFHQEILRKRSLKMEKSI